MKKFIILILSVLVFSSFVGLHKFYVSVTQVEYKQEEASLQIISRLFIDDIEELLQERYNKDIVLGAKGEKGKVDVYLDNYLHQKMEFIVNDSPVSFDFLGKEYEDDQLLCYIEITGVSRLSSVKITNETLMDLFTDQQNIIHFRNGSYLRSVVLEKGNETMMLKFSE